MSDYRDTVREMMRDLKANKGSVAAVISNEQVPSSTEVAAPAVVEVPNEEDLLDDILDLQEGAPVPIGENEAEDLLKSSDSETDSSPKKREAPKPACKRGKNNLKRTHSSTKEEIEPPPALPKSDKEEESKLEISKTTDPNEKSDVEEPEADKEDSSDGGSSIEMLGESSKKSNDENEDNDEASNSSSSKKKDAASSPPQQRTRRKRPAKKEPEVVELSSNDENESDEHDQDEDSEDDEVGDPNKAPGEGSSRSIHSDYLQPFLFGWRREVVYRARTRHESASQCDIYYHPPQDGRYRTREAKRKRRSKADQERYFEDFPDENLSIKNFNYVRRPLGLENAAYEIVRKSKQRNNDDNDNGKKSMKEVEESAGLLEESDDEDEEIKLICGFDPDMPISLQAFSHISGMQSQYKKRRKLRDPETCCTPPMVEDSLWTDLDDDPFGVFTDLGGRSSPVTPPPLRSVKLTYSKTAEKIAKAFQEVRDEAIKIECTKEIELVEDLASHDAAIMKYKHVKASSTIDPSWYPMRHRNHQQYASNKNQRGQQRLASSLIMKPAIDRPCTPKCPNSVGILPSMQCVSCKAMYHAKCQGIISPNLRVFRCKRCLSRLQQQANLQAQSVNHVRTNVNESNSVKMRLPMMPKNGKRPMVELVLRTPEGRYQPIKFRNNSQITETIPRTLFHRANMAKKTLYVKSNQLPRLNGKPVFLAINPVNMQPKLPGVTITPANTQQQPAMRPQQRPQQPLSDQVSILVKPQKAAATAKPVLLNVPRKVALKVKVGTTLSFSASNDQKYIVMDSKIHPAVGSGGGRSRVQSHPQQPAAKQPRLALPPSLSVIPNNARGSNIARPNNVSRTLANLMNNKQTGLTVTRGPVGRSTSATTPVAKRVFPAGSSVLASGEVISSSPMAAATPCTPYCPGASGVFPDLECTHCQSLFHSKCVGIHHSVLERVRSKFRCRICTPVGIKPGGPRSSSVTVIDLD